jgi:hypothetical protein
MEDEVQLLKKELAKANSLLRSACSIAQRKGEKTNWDAFGNCVLQVLFDEHEILRDYWIEESEEVLSSFIVDAPAKYKVGDKVIVYGVSPSWGLGTIMMVDKELKYGPYYVEFSYPDRFDQKLSCWVAEYNITLFTESKISLIKG